MLTWYFTVSTIEKGRISYKVKANDKTNAIKKGFELLDKKGLTYSNHFECSLIRL